jgi:hypothetical protein
MGDPVVPHEPPPSALRTDRPRWTSRPAKRASGRELDAHRSLFRPVAQRRRAVGFEPTRARSNRAGAVRRGDPVVPPRAPSFCVVHVQAASGLPAGKAGLRPRRPRHTHTHTHTTSQPRVAQLRRAPLLQRGGWRFESFAADTPLKLSSAEQPPCKRTVVGSIPTWGSFFPS